VAQFLCENLTYYCSQKISSNVVESAIKSNTCPEAQVLFFKYLEKNYTVFKALVCD
jgi:H2-forming N5,N10-methylenetetrahydromethanopterin dehydrogenase-like enzyme